MSNNMILLSIIILKSIDSRCVRSLRGEVVNPLFTYELSHPYHLDEPTFIYICISFFDEIQVSKQNGQDGTQRFAASHLGLFCLPMSNKKDDRLI